MPGGIVVGDDVVDDCLLELGLTFDPGLLVKLDEESVVGRNLQRPAECRRN